MTGRTRTAYQVALAAWFGLFALLVVWNVWLVPSELPLSVVLLVGIGPLLLPLRGLLHGRPYTFAWTSMLALLYFIHGVGEAFSDPADRPYALAEVVLALALYVSAMLYARWRGRELKA